MASFAGLRGTGDWGVDERPKNFREMILWRNPNGSAPLTALMSRMKSESVDDPEFSWWEEENNCVRVQNGGAILGTTDVTETLVSGGLALVTGDVLLVETPEDVAYTAEVVTVTSVTSDTVIVIARGAAGTTATAIPANTFYTKIGNAFAEGTNSPDVSNRNPTKLTNLCQIFKTAYELTETTKKTRARTGDPLKNDKKRKMFDHSVALEKAWFFGKQSETTGANGKPLRYTGGLRESITTNVTLFSTTPTEDTFLDAIFPVFDYEAEVGPGGNERLIFAGNVALNRLNKMARDSASSRINFEGTVKTYGMELQKWVLPQGTVFVKTHPLFNVHGLYKNSMFVLNPAAIIYRPLRDTKMEDNIQANDADTQKGQWLTEAGIEARHEKTMAYLGNFV